ncbi:MAG: TolC family protein [Planctomycetes bacterium]|nr:TolC family protein [Planctomycetota bacterium]
MPDRFDLQRAAVHPRDALAQAPNPREVRMHNRVRVPRQAPGTALRRSWSLRAHAGWAVVLALSACTGTPSTSERAARSDLSQVSQRYRPGDAQPALPALTSASPLSEYMQFALLNAPRVEAAYFDWVAAVERITPARSLPDPRLTFEADITNTIQSLMPGLMIDLPAAGKLRAAGEAQAAESRAAYYGFEREILWTALAVKTAYYRLHFLEETIRVQHETLRLLRDLEDLARQQHAAGRVTLQDVLRAQIGRAQVETRIESLEDSRTALVAELKSALGLGPLDAAPPIPSTFSSSEGEPRPDELLTTALVRNPDLRAMEEDVLRAEALLGLARKSGVPDFSFGLEVDLKSDPTLLRPSAAMTVPIWRDKIAAEIAGAQASKRAAQARLTAEQVRIAADLTAMLFVYREAVRNEALLRDALVPKARQSLDAARAGYVNGRASFLDVIDAQRTLLDFELTGVEARTQRELALASLSLTIAGVPPSGAPILERGAGRSADGSATSTPQEKTHP